MVKVRNNYIDDDKGNIVIELEGDEDFIEETIGREFKDIIREQENIEGESKFEMEQRLFTRVNKWVKKKYITKFLKSGEARGTYRESYMQSAADAENIPWTELRSGVKELYKDESVTYTRTVPGIVKEEIKKVLLNKVLEYVPEDSHWLAEKIKENSKVEGDNVLVGNDGDPSVDYWYYLEHKFTKKGEVKKTWYAKESRMEEGVGKESELMPPLKTAMDVMMPEIINIAEGYNNDSY